MRVWSATTLPTAAVIWRASSGAWSLTAVAKATFSLAAGESPLSPAQEPIHTFDRYEGSGALWAPSDLAPFKVRPDVTLVGSAFAPRPVTSLAVRLIVGTLEKAIEVHAPRHLDDAGRISEGVPFTSAPLGWDRAAGGPETQNPVGASLDHVDGKGRTPLPTLMLPGAPPPGRGDYVEPVSFAPLPPTWPARAHLAGGVGPQVMGTRWFEAPLPPDVHPAFFNAASADQQPEYLADDPRIVLEHLSPAASRLSTTLAPVRVALYVEGGRSPGRYGMRPDSLWIDTDRQICCVTYRATVPLIELDPAILATVLSDPPTPLPEPTAIAVVGLDDGDELSNEETSAGDDEHTPSPETPPRDRQSTSTSMFSTEASGFAYRESEAPQAPVPPPVPPPAPSAPALEEGLPFRSRKPAQTRPIDDAKRTSATPFDRQPPLAPPLAPPLVPPPPPMRAAEPTTPPPVIMPIVAPALAPPRAAAPLPAPPAMRPSAPDVLPHPVAAAPVPAAPQPRPAPAPAAAPAWMQPSPEPPRRVEHDAVAALDGVVGASNAAARPDVDASRGAARAGGGVVRPRVVSNDVVDLVWFAEALPARIRAHEPWSDAVRDEARLNDWITSEESADKPKEDLRRFVTRALGRVPPTDLAVLPRLLSESVDEEGFVDRPLVIVAGELSMSFDPIEVLKSSVELASQLASSEKLKEAIDASTDVAKAQRVSTPLVDGLLQRIRQAFAQANRNLPNDYLETTVQRTLLEERKYLKRQVLGQPHLVAALAAGAGATTTTYLPGHLADQIPVLQRFRVRLVAEPHPSQHPGDGEGATLRVLSLGRVIGTRPRAG